MTQGGLFDWISLDWVMQTGLAVTLLIGLVLIIRRPFAKIFGARATYVLWLLPLIRVFMPTITVPRIFPETAINKVLDVTPTSPPSEMMFLIPDMMDLTAKPSWPEQLLPIALGVWIIGAAGFFFYHWLRQAAYMDKLLYNSESAQGLKDVIQSATLIVGLKHIPQVRIADDDSGPLVSGLLRPVVILPSNFTESFSQDQQHFALLHECMHIKRGDLFMAAAWLAFRSLNWPNPLAHYAAKHFRSDQEAACDASVLKAMGGGAQTLSGYAETLVHAAKAAATKTSSTGRASPQPSALALTIHHPLKERLMILGTHRKPSNWRSRIAAAIMIIGAATLSAPIIQADAHPEEELAGKAESHEGKSVIKRKYKKDGKTVSEHYEINIDGDDIKAFKVGPFGKKTEIDVDDIEGVDIADLKAGHKGFIISDNDGVKFMSQKDFKKWAETEYPQWKENDFASWVDGDFKAWVSKMQKGKVEFHSKDGKHFELNSFPHPPKPPFPPGLSKHSESVFVLKSDDFKGLEGHKKLESLKGLKGLEKLEALKNLENLEGLEAFTFFSNDDDKLKLKMRLTESKLASALSLLEDTVIEDSDSREVAKAKRELEKARKALRAAERALKDN